MSKSRNYTEEEKRIALEYYHECKHVCKTIRDLGYPSRVCLYDWLAVEGKPKKPPKKKIFRGHASVNERFDAIKRCIFNGEDVYLIAEDIHRHVTTVRTWIRTYRKEGISAIMDKQRKRCNSNSKTSPDEIDFLKTQIMELQIENDI